MTPYGVQVNKVTSRAGTTTRAAATTAVTTTQLAKKGVDLILQRINYPYHATHKTTPFHLIEGESVMELNN